MAEDVTSWIAKALIDQEALYGGEYQRIRHGFLVQVIKFETYRDSSHAHRQIIAIAHDRTHSVKLAFDVGVTDRFEASQHGVPGESLTSHLRHIFHIKRYRFDLAPPHPNKRPPPRVSARLPEVILQVLEWEVNGGSIQDPVFHDRVAELGYGMGDVRVQRVLLKFWSGESISQEYRQTTGQTASGGSIPASSNPSQDPLPMSTFLFPYLFPAAGKKPKPIPDWLFVVSDDDRKDLDEIRLFGHDGGPVDAEQGTDEHVPRAAAAIRADSSPSPGADIDLRLEDPVSSPATSDSRGSSPRPAEEHGEAAGSGSEEGSEDGLSAWAPTPDVRRTGPAAHHVQEVLGSLTPGSPTSGSGAKADRSGDHDGEDVWLDESVDYPVPPRPPTASPGQVTNSAANESLQLYPQRNISRDPTPAVIRGYNARRPVKSTDLGPKQIVPADNRKNAVHSNKDNREPGPSDVPTSQQSRRSTSPILPLSSGQSMIIKRPRKPARKSLQKGSESMDVLPWRNTQSTEASEADHEQDGMRAEQTNEHQGAADTEMSAEDEIEMLPAGTPQPTMPFPPAGQKRSVSPFLHRLPTSTRETSPPDEGYDNGRDPPRTSSPILDIHETDDVAHDAAEADQVEADRATLGAFGGNKDAGRVSSQDGLIPASRAAAAGPSNVDATSVAATRPMPTAGQRLASNPRPDVRDLSVHQTSDIAISSFSVEAATELHPATSNENAESLESDKTSTSLPSEANTRTGTHGTISTDRLTEGQQPVLGRGYQTSWIGASAYDLRLAGGNDAGFRDPTPSLSQSQSQDGDMSLSRYASMSEAGRRLGTTTAPERQPVMAMLQQQTTESERKEEMSKLRAGSDLDREAGLLQPRAVGKMIDAVEADALMGEAKRVDAQVKGIEVEEDAESSSRDRSRSGSRRLRSNLHRTGFLLVGETVNTPVRPTPPPPAKKPRRTTRSPVRKSPDAMEPEPKRRLTASASTSVIPDPPRAMAEVPRSPTISRREEAHSGNSERSGFVDPTNDREHFKEKARYHHPDLYMNDRRLRRINSLKQHRGLLVGLQAYGRKRQWEYSDSDGDNDKGWGLTGEEKKRRRKDEKAAKAKIDLEVKLEPVSQEQVQPRPVLAERADGMEADAAEADDCETAQTAHGPASDSHPISSDLGANPHGQTRAQTQDAAAAEGSVTSVGGAEGLGAFHAPAPAERSSPPRPQLDPLNLPPVTGRAAADRHHHNLPPGAPGGLEMNIRPHSPPQGIEDHAAVYKRDGNPLSNATDDFAGSEIHTNHAAISLKLALPEGGAVPDISEDPIIPAVMSIIAERDEANLETVAPVSTAKGHSAPQPIVHIAEDRNIAANTAVPPAPPISAGTSAITKPRHAALDAALNVSSNTELDSHVSPTKPEVSPVATLVPRTTAAVIQETAQLISCIAPSSSIAKRDGPRQTASIEPMTGTPASDNGSSSLGAAASSKKARRRSSRPRPPLLGGFVPKLELPFGLNMEWFEEERRAVGDIRRQQAYL